MRYPSVPNANPPDGLQHAAVATAGTPYTAFMEDRASEPPRRLSLTPGAIEHEIHRLFDQGSGGLVIRVQAEDDSASARNDAFRELLESLSMYDERYRSEGEIYVEPPDAAAIARAVGVLALPRLKRKLFERVLWTFGQGVVNPLGEILEGGPAGSLLPRMQRIRRRILAQLEELGLTHETRQMLASDLEKLLSDDYLALLADNEERVQRPKTEELARESLHLIGTTFQRAFRGWPEHAQIIADAVHRKLGSSIELRKNPVAIREHIVSGIEDFLWVETSTELSGALSALYAQPQYAGILGDYQPQISKRLYRDFADSCWDLVADNC